MSKKFLLIVFTVFFGAALLTYLTGDYESLANQLWNLLPPLAAATCGIQAVRVYGINNPHAKAIAFMALGVFFWFLGDFIWFILEYFLNKYPFPSIADYFYILAYPLLLTGLVIELRNNKMKWTSGKIVCCALLSIILATIVVYLGVIKAYDPTESLLINTIAMAYGLGDLILILLASAILMVAISYHKGKLFYPWLFILIGFFLLLIADVLFATYQTEYENFMGLARNIDLGWISGYLFIGFGFFSIGDAIKETREKLLLGKL